MSANLRQKLGKSLISGKSSLMATRASPAQAAVVNYTQQSKDYKSIYNIIRQ